MRLINTAVAATIAIVLFSVTAFAQGSSQSSSSSSSPSSSSVSSVSAPRLITLSGTFRPAEGQPIGHETVTFAIYADEVGGTPLWQETQVVEPEAGGRYTVLLGATPPDGVPSEIFASGEARWLGISWLRGRDAGRDAGRSRLTFVPYAMRAADADTLGGKPASAYALAPASDGTSSSDATAPGDTPRPKTVFVGGTNQVAKYVNGTDITPSTIYEGGGMVGMGTTAPLDALHVRFTDTSGGFTGYAVQNLGSGAASYSGTLFYDQAGALGQFQGFNNSTHEYRINNVAKNASSVFNGTINFMIGSIWHFYVSSGGQIGINVTAPVPVLDISNNGTVLASSNVTSTTYQTGGLGSVFTGRKARGTVGAPSAVLNGDNLALFQGRGYGATAFGGGGGNMVIRAFENWTDTAQGTAIQWQTTRLGTTALSTMMTLNPNGDLGIGTAVPSGALEISRSSGDYEVVFTAYAGGANLLTRKARGGNPAAPTAALVGDELGGYAMAGYGTTSFGQGSAAMGAYAAENSTDTRKGRGCFSSRRQSARRRPTFPS